MRRIREKSIVVKKNGSVLSANSEDMRVEVKVPVLPESVSDGELIVWNKSEGDAVQRDEVLAELETDKVVLEIPAPQDGVLEQILIKAGTTVTSEEIIAVINSQSDGAASAPKNSPAKSERSKLSSTDAAPPVVMKPGAPALSPAVRKLVEQHELDPSGIAGTGKGGRITKEDVLGHLSDLSEALKPGVAAAQKPASSARATLDVVPDVAVSNDDENVEPSVESSAESGAERNKGVDMEGALDDIESILSPEATVFALADDAAMAALEKEAAASSTPSSVAPAVKPSTAPSMSPAIPTYHHGGERVETREPMSRLRSRIAERLVEAQQTAAILTTFNEVNLQPVMDLRKRYQADFQQRHGVKLGFMSFFVKACAEALELFPVINASVEGKEIVYHEFYDIGIAVGSPRGLVVPILRDCDRLGFADIESSIKDFSARAQDNSLGMDDLTGGTFTISNGGVYGSMLSTPILNPPQSAILGMHNIQQRPVVIDGEIVARPMMYLALSYDHRIIDGKEAVQFLVAVKESLEDPARLLLQV